MTQGKGSKRRPSAIDDATYAENYARTFKGPERIDAIMQRVAVPMHHRDKAIAVEPHGEATRITPKTELDDPYA